MKVQRKIRGSVIFNTRKKVKKIFKSTLAVFLAVVMFMLPVTSQAAAAMTSVTVSTQVELTKALADKNIKTITIMTPNAIEFNVPNIAYKTKTLVINSPKATVTNSGIFKKLIVTDAKTITENAKGNTYTVGDKKVTLKVAKNAEVKTITFGKKNAKCNIVAYGNISQIVLSKKSEIALSGNTSDHISIQIKAAAKGSIITSSLPVDVTTATDASISLKKGAEKSTVTSTDEALNLKIENKTTKSIKVTTADGKKTLAAGKTMSTKNEPTKAPESSPAPTKAPEVTPTPTIVPESTPTSTPADISNPTYYTVTFDVNGGTPIDSVQVADGNVITNLPIPVKDNNIFLGWFTDSGHQYEFTEDTAVYSNLTLYARFSEITTEQQYLVDSYALTEQQPGISFTIVTADTTMAADSVKGALVLDIADGSEAVELTVTGSNGTFNVAAQNGFTEGASYTLTLSDSKLSFAGKESTIRNCSFSITKAEVNNMKLNKGIIYIPASDISNITKNGTAVESLSVSVASLTESSEASTYGTFIYNTSTVLSIGDILCIYSGDNPGALSAGASDAELWDDDIAYIKVADVAESAGSQVISYTVAETEEVLFIPDVLPIAVGDNNKLTDYTAAAENTTGSLTVALSNLNFGTYSDMGLSEATTIDEGDYLALYTGSFNANSIPASVSYGRVNAVTENNGNVTVTFTATTMEEMKDDQDYYVKKDIDGDTLLEGVDVTALEKEIEQQVQESDFAEKTSEFLAELALKTDGFKELAGDNFNPETVSVKMADGENNDLNVIHSMSLASPKTKAFVKDLIVIPKITDRLQKLNRDGVRCTCDVSFEVLVEVDNGDKITIPISATFVQEMSLSIAVSGNAIWNKAEKDYRICADINFYDYTGVNFKATVTSKSGASTIDISKQIQKLLNYTKSEQISSGAQELFKMYSEIMENGTTWQQLVNQNLSTYYFSVCFGVVTLTISADFIIGAQINIALGCDYEYKNGIKYIFWVKVISRESSSEKIGLMDRECSFNLYVLGSLGLRAGVKLTIKLTLTIIVEIASISLSAEAGVYVKLYGFFYFHAYNNWANLALSGIYYMELGSYMDITFKANALEHEFAQPIYNAEWPQWVAGSRYNVFDFAYSKTTSTIEVKEAKKYTLPDSTFNMNFLDLLEGDISTRTYKASDFYISFSNKNFSIVNNEIKINVPKGIHQLECDMTVTYQGSYPYFSCMYLAYSRTFHLLWDDYNKDGYTINFDSRGGSAVNCITKLFGKTVTAPTVPVRAGYTFGGWYSDEKLTTKYIFSTMPAYNIVLYAKWTANSDTQYKVEFYQQNTENDNYTLYTTKIWTGTTDTTASVKSVGYDGFTYNNSVKGTISSGIITGEGSLVLKLYFDRNLYTLTFIKNNGSKDIVETVKYGAAISAPTLIKKGYTFMGWDFPITETMPAADTTYTAQWAINNYTIEFNTNGGNTIDKITQAYGSTVTSPIIPVRKGYTFLGWYRDSSFTKPYTFSTIPAENIILYAKWDIKTIPYSVEYYQQNSSGKGYTLKETENLKDKFNTAVAAKVKTYEGFALNSSVKGTLASGILTTDENLALKLYYDRNTYIISFTSSGGSKVAAIEQKYGTPVSAPKDPVRPGYTFEGWYSDEKLTTKYIFNPMPAMNIVLYDKWAIKTDIPYKVEYYQQNLSDDEYSLVETIKLSGIFDTTVTAADKTYEGFTLSSGSAGKTVSSGIVAADGSLTLKMYYNRNSYSISFATDGGSSIAAISGKYGTDVSASAPKDLVRLGYTFEGWYSDEKMTAKYTFSTIPAMNIVLYDKWSAKTDIPYKVEYYQQNLSDDEYSLVKTENLSGVCDTTVTAAVKTYEGFNLNSSGAGKTVSSGIVAADGSLMLKMYYDRNICSISFATDGGSDIAAFKGKYGTKVSAPEAPVKLDYTFGGWYSDIAMTSSYNFSSIPAESITINAKWNMNENIEYKFEMYIQQPDGEYVLRVSKTFTGKVNTTVTASPETLTDYIYNSTVIGALSSGILTPGGKLTLRMYYDRKSYTITFDSNGGSKVAAITLQYGTMVEPPNNPVKLGYLFAGWYYDKECNNPYTFSNLLMDALLYAKWTQGVITTYKVEHYQQNAEDDGYKLADTETIDGTVDTTVAAVVKTYEGFTFNSSADGTATSGIVAENGGLTLKLYYVRNKYTISFITSGGSEVKAITQKYGSFLSAPENPTREGCTFVGWCTDFSLTKAYILSKMPAGDITLCANWKWNTDTE